MTAESQEVTPLSTAMCRLDEVGRRDEIHDGGSGPRPALKTVATMAPARSMTGRLEYLFFISHIFPDLFADKEDGGATTKSTELPSPGCLLEGGDSEVESDG